MISSSMPSLKYSLSLSALMLANGSTAIDGRCSAGFAASPVVASGQALPAVHLLFENVVSRLFFQASPHDALELDGEGLNREEPALPEGWRAAWSRPMMHRWGLRVPSRSAFRTAGYRTLNRSELPLIETCPLNLLRRHVGRRPAHDAVRGARGIGVCADQLRQTEIQELGNPE